METNASDQRRVATSLATLILSVANFGGAYEVIVNSVAGLVR